MAAPLYRMLVLAAVAMLGVLVVIAVQERRDAGAATTSSSATAPGQSGWYVALAAPRPPAGDAERTTCDLILTARSLGVTHPVLPCGAKLVLRYRGESVLTEVIDNTLTSSGRQFELTDALARLVGLDGTQQIEWRYAKP